MKEITVFEHLQNPELVFVAFDLETTGLSPSQDRIVEIGAVKFQDGKVVSTMNRLVNPGIPIPASATAVNKITDDMVADKPELGTVLPEFLQFCDGAVMVAHNASFDTAFVLRSMSRLGLGTWKNDYIDTKIMAQRAFPGRGNYKLQDLAAENGILAKEAHRAQDDARVCMELFQVCLKKLNPGGQSSFF